MAIPFATSIDAGLYELLNLVAQNLAVPPPHKKGRIYYDTALNQLGISNGTSWTYVGAGGSIDPEDVQNIVGAMFDGNTTIPAAYNATTGKVTLSIGSGVIFNEAISPTAAITLDKLAETATLKLMTLTERTKLAGIAGGATANQTDTYLLNRANHTGTQLASTISDLDDVIGAAIAAVVDGAPEMLDTLREIAEALNNDPDFFNTLMAEINLRAKTADLAPVAFAGTYASLTDKPVYTTTIGDGVATSFVVNHNLNTRNVLVGIHRASSPYQEVLTEVQKTTTNSVTLYFGSAPAAGEYTVTIQA